MRTLRQGRGFRLPAQRKRCVSDAEQINARRLAAEEELVEASMKAFTAVAQPIYRGASWTTDAPFRETAAAIALCRSRNILAVEMEAAGLYAFSRARGKPVLCFAHVTNQMAVIEGDFEKGAADGSAASLSVITAAATAWRQLEIPDLSHG